MVLKTLYCDETATMQLECDCKNAISPGPLPEVAMHHNAINAKKCKAMQCNKMQCN